MPSITIFLLLDKVQEKFKSSCTFFLRKCAFAQKKGIISFFDIHKMTYFLNK